MPRRSNQYGPQIDKQDPVLIQHIKALKLRELKMVDIVSELCLIDEKWSFSKRTPEKIMKLNNIQTVRRSGNLKEWHYFFLI